jgi:hypothetical protein
MKIQDWVICCTIGLGASLAAGSAVADESFICSGLPGQAKLQMALEDAVKQNNGGLGFNMWATLVANDGGGVLR